MLYIKQGVFALLLSGSASATEESDLLQDMVLKTIDMDKHEQNIRDQVGQDLLEHVLD